MKTITITQKDIEKAGIQFTDSSYLIDELAHSAKLYTSDEATENCFEYEPREPYMYDYEADLLNATKTAIQLFELADKIDNEATFSLKENKDKLQAGAYIALNYPTQWAELLEAYTEALKDNRADGISPAYNKDMQENLDSFYDDVNREYLYGDRSDEGVVSLISKYYTENRNATYDKKAHTFTFEIETDGDGHYQTKAELLESIRESASAYTEKQRQDREKCKAEREKTAIYKKERSEAEAIARKEKLLSMKIK